MVSEFDAPAVVEAAPEEVPLVTEVPGEAHQAPSAVRRMQAAHDPPGAIGRTVVDQDDFVVDGPIAGSRRQPLE